MLTLHAFATPNSLKPAIALEELGLPYELRAVDLRKGEQRGRGFLAMSRNGKVPVLIDDDLETGSQALGESAAILVHLAERGGALLPLDAAGRAKVFEQLFFHASAVSPAFLEAFLLSMRTEPDAIGRERALKEVVRVLAVLDQSLEDREHVAGHAYTIADIAHFGWLWRHHAIGLDLDRFPNLARWFAAIFARPAVQTAITRITALAV